MYKFLFGFFFCCCLFAKEEKLDDPWYTGSLLATSAENTAPGTYVLQPYLNVISNYGIYNNNFSFTSQDNLIEVLPLTLVQGGIFSFLDYQLLLQASKNYRKDASDYNMGDTQFLIGFQLATETKNIPYIRFTIQESFPTGNYENLNLNKLGTDVTGSGSYETFIGLNFSKLFYPSLRHPLRVRLNLNAIFFSRIKAKGFNAYGGSPDANDRVHPGTIYEIILAPEYSLTQRWVLTSDIIYTHQTKGHIKHLTDNTKETMPSSDVFILTPSIEYNFSKDVGLIGGLWFSALGRNTNAFFAGVLSLVYTF